MEKIIQLIFAKLPSGLITSKVKLAIFITRFVVRHPYLTVGGALSLITLIRVIRRYYRSNVYEVEQKVSLGCVLNNILIDRTRWFMNEWHLDYQGTNCPKFERRTDNGHIVSGAARDSAVRYINDVIAKAGMRKYEISPSKNRVSWEGIVDHIVPHDLHVERKCDHVDAKHVIVGIDIDYYIQDMNKMLCLQQPCAFYTFIPTQVSGVDGDSSYHIEDDHFVFNVSGGAIWQHKQWDWGKMYDYVSALDHYSWLGYLLSFIGVQRIVNHKKTVVQINTDVPNRVVVWLLPDSVIYRIKFLDCRFRCHFVERCKYGDVQALGWNKLIYEGEKEPIVSIGPNKECCHLEMPLARFEILRNLPTGASVSTRMLQFGHNTMDIALFQQYYTQSPRSLMGESIRIGRCAKITPFAYVPLQSLDHYDDNNWRTVGASLVDQPNAVPVIRKMESVSQSIDTRITFVINNKAPSWAVMQFAREFVEMVSGPEAGNAHPYSVEEAASYLDKASQIAAVNQVWDTLDCPFRQKIECFIKNEPTNKPNRIISSFPDARFLLQLSQFTLRIRNERFHDLHFFMPGFTPREIVGKVREYIQNVNYEPIEGDFSNFDGTVSSWIQENVVNAIYLRYFSNDYMPELSKMLHTLVSCPASAKRFNLKYEAGPGIKSGSPTTCDGNTLINAFIMYCSIRQVQKHATPEEAFGQIGLAFGDDSLFERCYKSRWSNIASNLGMKLKVVEFKPDEGITFLSRVYVDPYTTDSTFQDPLRTLRKLHLTSRVNTVSIHDAAMDRTDGYLVTDSKTPIISDYCKVVQNFHGPDSCSAFVRQKRADSRRDKPFWCYETESWPQDEVDVDKMVCMIAKRLMVSDVVVRSYVDYLRTCVNPYEVRPIILGIDDEIVYEGTVNPEGDFGLDIGIVSSKIEQNVRRNFERIRNPADCSDEQNSNNNREYEAGCSSNGVKRQNHARVEERDDQEHFNNDHGKQSTTRKTTIQGGFRHDNCVPHVGTPQTTKVVRREKVCENHVQCGKAKGGRGSSNMAQKRGGRGRGAHHRGGLGSQRGVSQTG